MVNWDGVGVISGVVVTSAVGLYTAIRNSRADGRNWVSGLVESVRKELGGKLDAVGLHLDKQDVLVDDARTRLARVEGRLGPTLPKPDDSTER